MHVARAQDGLKVEARDDAAITAGSPSPKLLDLLCGLAERAYRSILLRPMVTLETRYSPCIAV